MFRRKNNINAQDKIPDIEYIRNLTMESKNKKIDEVFSEMLTIFIQHILENAKRGLYTCSVTIDKSFHIKEAETKLLDILKEKGYEVNSMSYNAYSPFITYKVSWK